jgi:acetyl-CoA carboxylase biotin carboxyl carrier protein
MGGEGKVSTIELKSDITGTVWKILKKVGEQVAEDEPIVILESMKMEIPVTSAEPGTVKEILVEEGTIVAEGAVIVRLDV